MVNLKVGDIVARKSYNYDVLFKVNRIYNDMADLIGINVRIIADSPIYDLKIVSPEQATKILKDIELNNRTRLSRTYSGLSNKFNIRNNYFNNMDVATPIYSKESILKKPGVVLHIDGDAEYAIKCKDVYKKMGITAHVFNIKESEQPKHIYNLLTKIRPNILVITSFILLTCHAVYAFLSSR